MRTCYFFYQFCCFYGDAVVELISFSTKRSTFHAPLRYGTRKAVYRHTSQCGGIGHDCWLWHHAVHQLCEGFVHPFLHNAVVCKGTIYGIPVALYPNHVRYALKHFANLLFRRQMPARQLFASINPLSEQFCCHPWRAKAVPYHLAENFYAAVAIGREYQWLLVVAGHQPPLALVVGVVCQRYESAVVHCHHNVAIAGKRGEQHLQFAVGLESGVLHAVVVDVYPYCHALLQYVF